MHNNSTLLVTAHPHVPTTVAWDNIDRLEETLTGGGTSHRVNGIAIQPKVEGPMQQSLQQDAAKTKKRSISVDLPELPSYNAGQRLGPPRTETKRQDTASEILKAKQMNILWFMSRLMAPDNHFVSSWTGFNIQIRDDITVVQDTITYLPTINAPATQMSTVYEVLEQTLRIMEYLHISQIVCVFDQALYAKAAEIVWKNQKFKHIIIRMGAFHTICNMLGIIGKRFQHAGLGDLCVEAGILAEGSVAGVMDGRRYNRAVRLHKVVYEALLRLAWIGFYPWLEKNHPAELHCIEDTIQTIEDFLEKICHESFQNLLTDEKCKMLLDLFKEYTKSLRDTNALSAFWLSYLDMVDTLLNLIRASREGDWLLHLAAIKDMMPWCFAYEKINYARFLPYYYASMTNLQSDHPEVFDYFMKGGFSVQIGSHNPFGRIPVDQATEETVNKDTQTAGGTKGFSLKSGAVSKYYLTSEYRSRYLKQLRDMVDQTESETSHPDLQVSRIKRDVADVESVVQLLETSWLNPFSPDNQELVSLSTAVAAPADVAKDLADAYKIGKEAYKNFREERIEVSAKFFDKMVKNNLKTFADLVKKPHRKCSTKEVVLKADRKLFGQMILVAESRKLHMTEVLSHPLGPLPWALANSDGSLRKTNKAALARALEKSACPAESIPQPSACVIDGMSLVQKTQGNDKTFAQLADTVLSQVMHEGAESSRIDVVFDVYEDISIKNTERTRRGSDTGIQYKSISPGHKIQQWRKLLCSPTNKTNLIKFLVDEWKTDARRERLNDKTLYVTCAQACFKLTRENCEEVQELTSSQEEADTRLLLHAKHAAESGMEAVVVTAEDTDVMVICLGFSSKIACPIFQKCGTKNRTRFNDIGKLSNALGESFCEALIGMHAFTGCDTVSAFCGRGKAMMMKLMRSNQEHQEVFRELGSSWSLSNDLFSRLQKMTCHMYRASSQTAEVNSLRYQLFCAKRGELDSSQLPPCEDCLFMHSLRANYQACIWRRCLQANLVPPHPKLNGWKLDEDGGLSVDWMRGPPAPEAVLDLLTCNCVRSCKLPSCTCLTNGLRCTDMCRLQTCSNQASEQELNQATEQEISDDLDDNETDTDVED